MKRSLPTLPAMRCDDDCMACCGIVPLSHTEYVAVVDFAIAKGVVPVAQGLRCPFAQGGKCTVYEVRPTMCQAFGHVPEMPCIKGYNTNVSSAIVNQMIDDSGARKGAMLLHEALVDFGIVKHIDEVIGSPLAELMKKAAEGPSPS
jgi:Fe-S-cluster containining protein